MTIPFQKRMMDYLRTNQSVILDETNESQLSKIYKAIQSKRTPKSSIFRDVLIESEGKLFVVKHIKPAPLDQPLPLDLSEAFVLKYDGDENSFMQNSLVLTEEMIDKDFDYELSNPENINRIAFALMTSFPFIEELMSKFQSSVLNVGRNESCPCDSGKKYKKCCGL